MGGIARRREGGGTASGPDPLAALDVIDRLTVGPARLDRQRLIMPYEVKRDGRTDRTELIYRFEEDVFDPADPGAANLASMVGAQVALNYGLFCREIAFRGPFDAADRRALGEWAENTAREIYVNKLLDPNPFLLGEVARLPVVRRERYLRASLAFDGEPPAPAPPWASDRARHAILSSGGKESLLTLGLLDEIGVETHPVFINESGRHWYTALNAYRRLATTHTGTARVWTNADRLFAWMLRHLPFVRRDFAKLRADVYPVRLWTVAVFLFGALPLLRRRGIGRLLIGDEYDTTIRPVKHGIAHYGGLYDQSRRFDNAMSRYFARKGWGVSQFSILRPLSELLVEKVLAERYPDLQRFQLSCHAAHLHSDGAMRPCGRCEKCRRVVGMLTALGVDAGRCGYEPDQIDACLRSLASRGVHQEAPVARHVLHLLSRAGRMPDGGDAGDAHPEVVRLRFDAKASPFEAVPTDLRTRLHAIFLEHAEGAVERRGRVWAPVDPMAPAVLSRPYPFEASRRARAEPARGGGGYLLAEMTWPEAQARFRDVDVAMLPVGAIEQHGPHLPLDTDAFDADYLVRRVAAACRDPKPLVLPLVSYGVSYHHEGFAGTLSVSPETLSRTVYEIGMDAARWGITKLVIVNGHGGNGPALHLAAQMINRDAHVFTCVDSGETSDTDVYALAETPNDVHAGEIETSTSLAVRPELVQMDKAPRSVARFSSKYLDFTSKRGVEWYARTEKISKSGVFGDATKATRDKGEAMWRAMTEHLVALVEHLKSLSLDEIHQRKY